MQLPSSGHVDLIVMSLEQALPIEVERLLGRVCRNALRERDLQAAPGLTVFLPRLEFLRLDTRQREEKRRIHVGPHGIAGEVRQLQAVPGRVELVTSEGLAWIGSFLHDVAVTRFNRDSVGLKGRASIRLSEWSMRRPLLAQIDGHVDIVENAVLALQLPQDATL